MTLATHALIGAAAASFTPQNPALGFALGFASHFAADAIPHWDYPIYSDSVRPKTGAPMKFDAALVRDSFDIGLDAAVGLALSLYFFATPAVLPAILAGAIGGILPDPLQFVYAHFKHQPFISLQRFHSWIHTNRRLREEGRHALGIISQVLLATAVVLAAKFFAF